MTLVKRNTGESKSQWANQNAKKTCSRRKAQETRVIQVTVGFGIAADWLKKGSVSSMRIFAFIAILNKAYEYLFPMH